MYEMDFRLGDKNIANILGNPLGKYYDDWAKARKVRFALRIKGQDLWEIDSYCLLGYYKEFDYRQQTKQLVTWDRGWLLMAWHEADIEMSTDASEGTWWHEIILNGTF